jgi:outer membrane immunogenic protein
MRKMAAGLCATASMISVAFAADLPRSVYKAPAVVAPIFSWTGFYLGVNLGYGWGKGDGTIGVAGFGSGPISGSSSGVLGGGQIGYNWQTGPVVFGVEADFQGSGAKGNVTATAPGWAMVATNKEPWFGTIRGRLGYAFDRTMIYATGGGLYGNAELNGTTTASGAFSSSATYWTWTVGGGIEHMFLPNWSAKFEYLYAGTPDKVPAPPLTTAISGSAHGNIVRAGLNYHF